MTVNVICAPPNGRNPGMATVDMGFATVADALGLDDVAYWRLFDQSEWLDTPGGSYPVGQQSWFDPDTGFTYRNLRGRIDEVLASGPVVYWGDFHHLAPYHRSVVSVLHDDIAACPDERSAAELVATHLMLRGKTRHDTNGVASFGSTLLLNSASDYASAYGEDLGVFTRVADRIHMRDGYSETVVGDLGEGPASTWRGADCAFLVPTPEPQETDGTVAVFFGRSALQPEQLAWLGRRLGRAVGLEPRWLDWGREPAFWPMGDRRRFRLAWPELEHHALRTSRSVRLATYRHALSSAPRRFDEHQPDMSELLERLAAATLVLTDTYHLALNAWRVGTPAVCVIDDPTGKWNVNSGAIGSQRDKRWDLYSNLDALPWLIDSANLRPGRAFANEIARIVEVTRDTGLARVIERRVTATIDRAKSTAVATVAAVTGHGDR